MATVNYTITPNTGITWTGSFTVNSIADTVNNTVPTFVTASQVGGDLTFSFIPQQISLYPALNNNYLTWRTPTIAGQYPSTGYSFDIWSNTLFANVDGGATWGDLSGNFFGLNSGKNTLMYDYDAPVAPFWGRGGNIYIFT